MDTRAKGCFLDTRLDILICMSIYVYILYVYIYIHITFT